MTNWIKKALGKSKKGALREELHVKKGSKISVKKLKEAEHSKNPLEKKRAVLAKTLRGFNK